MNTKDITDSIGIWNILLTAISTSLIMTISVMVYHLFRCKVYHLIGEIRLVQIYKLFWFFIFVFFRSDSPFRSIR